MPHVNNQTIQNTIKRITAKANIKIRRPAAAMLKYCTPILKNQKSPSNKLYIKEYVKLDADLNYRTEGGHKGNRQIKMPPNTKNAPITQ